MHMQHMQESIAIDHGVNHDQSVSQLKSFCRGEMSAVETYRQAIEPTREEWIVRALNRCMTSHEERVRLLNQRIMELGGAPPESSGAWGTFAKAVEGVAAASGEATAIAVLEQGEDHGLADYRSDLDNLDAESNRLVRDHILPRQIETHRTLSEIKHRLA